MATNLDTVQESDQPRPDFDEPTAPLGRIVSVSGSDAIVLLDGAPAGVDTPSPYRADMGTLLRVSTPTSVVIGMVSGLSVPIPSQTPGETEMRIAELELLGEFRRQTDGTLSEFFRGVSTFPSLGDAVFHVTPKYLQAVYSAEGRSSVRIGTIHQDENLPAHVITDQLLGKHFAVLGTTGSGKSCSVALLLSRILDQHANGHILLLDPHNEYYRTFEGRAEIITPENLQLPYWLLTFDEILEVLSGRTGDRESDAEILYEMIPAAKRRYAASMAEQNEGVRRPKKTGPITVDTPVPYRMSDIMTMINNFMGKLNRPQNLAPYKRLSARIETITTDGRYGFMFGNLTVKDNMKEILARIFRIPVDEKPITIMDLSGIPSEVLNVVVSVLCRMTFDLALWSGRSIPVTLVCEEAHRYVPQDPSLGFEPTKQAISRIAKEGRKYGVSLGVVSQRPSELDPTILSQCNTLFAMRLTNQNDQDFVRATMTDTGRGLLEFLPALSDSEAIIVGEGVRLPVRVRFDKLPPELVPRSTSTKFSEQWNADVRNETFLERIVERWRAQHR